MFKTRVQFKTFRVDIGAGNPKATMFSVMSVMNAACSAWLESHILLHPVDDALTIPACRGRRRQRQKQKRRRQCKEDGDKLMANGVDIFRWWGGRGAQN